MITKYWTIKKVKFPLNLIKLVFEVFRTKMFSVSPKMKVIDAETNSNVRKKEMQLVQK